MLISICNIHFNIFLFTIILIIITMKKQFFSIVTLSLLAIGLIGVSLTSSAQQVVVSCSYPAIINCVFQLDTNRDGVMETFVVPLRTNKKPPAQR
jgi:hypothetical protein